MQKGKSIYLSTETKERLVGAKPRHLTIVGFIQHLLDLYEALTPVERAQALQRQAQAQ